MSDARRIDIDPHLAFEGIGACAVRFDETESMPALFAAIELPASVERALARRRVEFAAGRWCAREAMRGCVPEAADAIVSMGSEREPLWPHGVIGSISHTRGIAAAIVAREETWRGVAIDIERWMDPGAPARLGAKIVQPGELEALVAATGWSPSEVLTTVFSAKECIYKALHREVRRYFGFHAARIEAIDLQARTWRGAVVERLRDSIDAGFVCEGRLAREGDVVITTLAVP